MIDTHCHLYVKAFDPDADTVMQRAFDAGINKFYLPAIDSSCTDRMDRLAAKYPENCFRMAGLHPCSVKENYEAEIAHVKDRLATGRFAGIGETGLDFYWDKTYIKEQYHALRLQAELALEYKLPLILHTRSANRETIELIKEYSGSGITGIFHCFGGSNEEAKEITALGFYLGIGGVLTYKNAGLAEALSDISLQHLVLETDAPYLAPVPMRGKRNESSYLVYIAEKLAEVKGVTAEEVKQTTTKNAEKIFGA